ncbi:hypothetical protein EIP86_000754 [Pleurotus ostreatoroseus]|nr:hypothetical protein EIP86_000754 [Pleurotus ostreatoroseus]
MVRMSSFWFFSSSTFPPGKHVVFGKVIRGYEIIKEIENVAVDQKDRPSVPIEISNCGELVLRKQEGTPKAQEEKSRSVSESEGESDNSRRHKKRRHKHRSETRDDDEEKRRHRKKSKHRRRSPSGSPRPKGENDDPEKKLEPEEETEEQYDARLEREEKERLEAARKRELERLKKQQEAAVSSNGVRFKGRGRMKYLDPELRRDDGREHRPY